MEQGKKQLCSRFRNRKSHVTSNSGKAIKTALAAVVATSLLFGGYTGVSAATATNPAGEGLGVAIGTGSNAQRDGVVAIGKNAHTNYAGGSGYANVNGDVAIGENATTHSYYDQSGSVAVGKNSYVENTIGQQEKIFAFGQTSFNKFGFGSLPQQPDKVVTGVAVGDNTYVRTGGTMVGSHNYRGKIGDITVNTDTYTEKRKAGLGIYSTTIGANSFTNGTVATTSGALNVISSDYDGSDSSKATKNFGATINGSLNSIESATSGDNVSGLANAVVGTANRTFNSNGSLVFGAGNEITNSIAAVGTTSITGSVLGGPSSVTAMAQDIRKLVGDAESGGATLAFGGGNKADYTQKTAIIGVNNTVKGTSSAVSKFNMIQGYKNTATNVNHVTVMGSNNTMENGTSDIIFGDNHKLTGTHANNIILGSTDTVTEITGVSETVSIGHNSVASAEDAIAMGTGASATSQVSVVIGAGSKETSTSTGHNTAVGYGDKLTNSDYGTALGNFNTITDSFSATAIGRNNNLEKASQSNVIGIMNGAAGFGITRTVTGSNQNILGNQNSVQGASNGILGNENDVATDNTFVLGNNVKTTVDNSVFLGDSSAYEASGTTTKGLDAYTSDTVAGKTVNFAGGDKVVGIVSVGSADQTRRIQNVAPGLISSTSTDAINGSQLNAVATKLSDSVAAAKTHYYSVNDINSALKILGNYNNDGAQGIASIVAGIGSSVKVGSSQFQGATASVFGTLNTVDASTGGTFDGVANSIVGVANTTKNTNAALIFGAGNLITNSYGDVNLDTSALDTSTPEGLAASLAAAVKDSGGDVLVIGGANAVDNGQFSQVTGIGNKLTGGTTPSQYNSITGSKNEATDVQHVTVMGSENNVTGTNGALILGDKRTLTGANGSLVLGSSASGLTTSVKNAVVIGTEANVTTEGGVALGANSVAAIDKGVAGYDPSTKVASTDIGATWKATAAAVSVGNGTAVTRQITSVAAGSADTDAVNVAQLKALETKTTNAATEAAKHTTVKAGDYATVTEGVNAAGGKEYTVSGPKLTSADGTVQIADIMDGGKKVGYNLAVDVTKLGIEKTKVEGGENVTVTSNTVGDTTTYTIKAKDTTLDASAGNALAIVGNTLTMSVKDTSNNEVKGSVDLSALASAVDTDTTYTMTGTENADNTTTITLKDSNNNAQTVTVATKDTRNTVKAGTNVTVDEAKNTDGSSVYTVNVKAGGQVASGDTGIVSGDTVYNETRVISDGNYVKKENTAGANISALDSQVKTNADNITSLGNTINNMGSQVGELGDRVNKVGAGAAALAALHPLDFDPDDKWDFSAGFGNYRNASAVAVGAFYRPNERTMFNLGWTMGDSRNMINAGFSVKLGSGNEQMKLSKSEMAQEISALKEQNEKTQAENREIRSELEALKAQVAQLAAHK